MSCRHYRYSVNTILERGLYINPCNCCNQLRGFLFFSKQHDTIGVSLAVDIGLYHTKLGTRGAQYLEAKLNQSECLCSCK